MVEITAMTMTLVALATGIGWLWTWSDRTRLLAKVQRQGRRIRHLTSAIEGLRIEAQRSEIHAQQAMGLLKQTVDGRPSISPEMLRDPFEEEDTQPTIWLSAPGMEEAAFAAGDDHGGA